MSGKEHVKAEEARPIKNGVLVRELLLIVSRAYHTGDRDAIESLGITPDEARAISEIPLADLAAVERFGGGVFVVSINREALRHCLDHTEREKRRNNLIERYICADAGALLMSELFGMTSSEHAAKRAFFGMGPPRIGRPTMPKASDRERIIDAWNALLPTTDEQSRYLRIAEDLDIAVGEVAATIHRQARLDAGLDKKHRRLRSIDDSGTDTH